MLEQKVAVIIGGTTGIGAATVRRFAQDNATVIFSGRKKIEGQALEKSVQKNIRRPKFAFIRWMSVRKKK